MRFFSPSHARLASRIGEEVLCLDGLPVLDAAKVADDHHLIEAAKARHTRLRHQPRAACGASAAGLR